MTQHKNIYTALAAAQAVMEPVVKGAVNPAFKSRYADLSDVVSVVRPALTANGIAFHHMMVHTDHGLMMRTILAHGESDTTIECDVPLIVAKQDMQGMKSATTYAKRIGLESVTGVAPDDDDGNAAAQAAPKGFIATDQRAELDDLLRETGSDERAFAKAVGAASVDQITAADFERAKGMLIKKRAKMQAEEAAAAERHKAEQSAMALDATE